MEFVELKADETEKIKEMSEMATEIVREHFDPIIGKAQNDYMLKLFQTEAAVYEQLVHGYRYYFVRENGRNLGFFAFYPKSGEMYLSKFYLYRSERGRGISRRMLNFVIDEARRQSLSAVELNVNKNNPVCRIYESLGFRISASVKNDIGGGFFMDDYIYRLELGD